MQFDQWSRRAIPDDLAAHYRAQGFWRDESLGDIVAAGLASAADGAFRVRSAFHPWTGTLRDVDVAARSLATALRARGVGAGDVIVFQLPNWVEAGITFWAAAYLGAVVVPVVHFYGPKELGYILDVTRPAVVVTADQFRNTDYVANYDELMSRHGDTQWLVVDSVASTLPLHAARFSSMLDESPLVETAVVDVDSPALIAFTSGTTSNPKGVVHSHRTIGFEARQLSGLNPPSGPPAITGAPVGHFIGMLNAFFMPLIYPRPVNLIDVWDPGEVLRMMKEEQLSVGGGATFFLTSLLDHPDFGPEHLALMPTAGLGGSTVPAAFTERAKNLGIEVYRSYGSTEHPSITGSKLSDPEIKRLRTDGRPMQGVEIRLDEEGQIISRGPDCCVGYTDPALTKAAFDADGWYSTGDVGVIDEDGYLTITDRISDFIIRGGENISAQEIEELLLGMDQIAEVNVVSAPDARLGEHAAAVIRLSNGATAPSRLEVTEHLSRHGLARQKLPESLYVVDEFPRTPSGKVQKFRLREQVRTGALTAYSPKP